MNVNKENGENQVIERKPKLEKALYPKELIAGYKINEILINFYGAEKDFELNKDSENEYNIVIAPDQLMVTIINLLKVGVAYQKEFAEDIGYADMIQALNEGDDKNE